MKELIKAALEAKKMAYTPYSNFNVGAALITKEGKIYSGCNIENASYGATNCAERTAIFKAVSEGHKTFTAMAITGSEEEFTYPCGICRQVMTEFALDGNVKIYLVKNENEYIEKTLEEIMPGSFRAVNIR